MERYSWLRQVGKAVAIMNDKKTILKKALGVKLFQSIYNFFQIIEEQDADVIVYISKKCYTLYREFAELLEPVGNKLHCSDIMILDVAAQYCGKKVLLVDDVLIHGRTLNGLKELLEEQGCIVELYAFAINTAPPALPETDDEYEESSRADLVAQVNIKDIVKYYYKCNAYEWKKISDLIVHSFWATNTPYCADLPAIILTQEGKKCLDANSKVFDVRACDTHSVGRMGQVFRYYYNSNAAEDLFSMVLMKNDKIKRYIWLPNQVLFSGSLNGENNQIEFYKAILPEKYLQLVSDLGVSSDHEEKAKTSFQFRFYRYMLSYVLMGDFIKCAGLTKDMYEIDHSNLFFSFGERFKKYFHSGIWNDANSSVAYKIICSEAKHCVSETKLEALLCKKLEKAAESTCRLYSDYKQFNRHGREKQCAHILSRFYKVNGNIDEEQVYVNRERIAGIPALKLVKQLAGLTDYSFRDVMTAFLNQYYLGYSTLSFKNDGSTIACYSHAGEQSYKCVVHEFVIPVYFSYRYEQIFSKAFSKKLRSVYLGKVKEVYDKNGIPFDETDFKTYSRGALENIYDEITIEEHCEESEKEGSIELVEIGYQLEAFARSRRDLKNDTIDILRSKFNDYCASNH